ncbi:hypothetical protein SLEP1_g7408 [Rubroshorea leprosula]|uniref:Reverse transcriptase Ty1/copia-type domain-containing protein n=1 Tax=Rubroshorea leprosula TaxID=152421 RepID=A0AAV5HYA3_9ROSI|nr:hypothetical protein SLEP1_g7408 [Rubroshorea leprosula]
MFSSLSNFQVSSFNQPPLFTNPSIKLFPIDFDVDTFDELHDTFAPAPPGSLKDVLPTDNTMDNAESCSLTFSVSLVGCNPVDIELENEILNPPLSRPRGHYKACLVAKGFTQEYGIDYEKTFAPIAGPTSVRSLIVIAAAKRWKLFHMNVKNAFLNGDLVEEVYMKPPLGLEHPPKKVC